MPCNGFRGCNATKACSNLFSATNLTFIHFELQVRDRLSFKCYPSANKASFWLGLKPCIKKVWTSRCLSSGDTCTIYCFAGFSIKKTQVSIKGKMYLSDKEFDSFWNLCSTIFQQWHISILCSKTVKPDWTHIYEMYTELPPIPYFSPYTNTEPSPLNWLSACLSLHNLLAFIT